MSDLTKLTVNLVPRAVVALNEARVATGDTATDTVNRALQVYAAVVQSARDPRLVIDVDMFHDDGYYRIAVKRRRWWHGRRSS